MKTKYPPFKVSLLPLADQINAARITANANDATAPQTGVYGMLVEALQCTLAKMAGVCRAEMMYEHILNGSTVQEARRITEPARPASN